MAFGSTLGVFFTLVYYNCVSMGLSWPVPGAVLTGVFMSVLIANIFMAGHFAAKPAGRQEKLDGLFTGSMYLNAFVVASVIQTPIGGLAWKTKKAAGE